MALGLLGLVEAVSIARSVATRSGQQIDGNQEFIGQAMSNILGGFSSSYATSGSFTRTGVNYEAGAKSPLAALFAATIPCHYCSVVCALSCLHHLTEHGRDIIDGVMESN